jgi:hypothetical protein
MNSLMLCTSLLLAQAAATDDSFKPLFDGKTLTGWEGSQKVFRIEDKAIVGGTLKANVPHNDFLCTTKEYGDFELRLKYRLLGSGANGGVQIRSHRVPNHFEVSGYQADMADGYWGCLYDESRRNKILAGPPPAERSKVAKIGDWYEYVIRCEGKRIQLWENLAEGHYRPADPRRRAERSLVPRHRNSGAAG